MKTTMSLILTVLLSLTYGTVMASPTVTVTNTESNPVPVKVLKDHTPLYGVYQIGLGTDSASACVNVVTVPDGQLLTIENISCAGNINMFQHVKCEIRVYPDSSETCHAIQFASQFMMPVNDTPTFRFFSWVQPLKLYAPSGSVVKVCASKEEQFDSIAGFDISVTSYYEPF